MPRRKSGTLSEIQTGLLAREFPHSRNKNAIAIYRLSLTSAAGIVWCHSPKCRPARQTTVAHPLL